MLACLPRPVRTARPLAALAIFALGACADVTPTGTPTIPDSPAYVRFGTPAGADFPAVVFLQGEIGGTPAYACSGTLIAPKLVLTAAHCIGEPGEMSGMKVFLQSDLEANGDRWPYATLPSIRATAWRTLDGYSNAAFFVRDAAVVFLERGVTLPAGAYGTLPTANQLSPLRPRASTTFTVVGYGVQRINPALLQYRPLRMWARPQLVQIDTPLTGGFSLLLSNNASTGGSCFGDSGGPNYLGTSNVIAALTSYGNRNCTGMSGVFRLDRADVLAFIDAALRDPRAR